MTVLQIVVHASSPSEMAQRAAERVADTVCGDQQLVNRGRAVFHRRGTALVDGRTRPVLVYIVHAYHRDDADGRSNDRWSPGSTGGKTT